MGPGAVVTQMVSGCRLDLAAKSSHSPGRWTWSKRRAQPGGQSCSDGQHWELLPWHRVVPVSVVTLGSQRSNYPAFWGCQPHSEQPRGCDVKRAGRLGVNVPLGAASSSRRRKPPLAHVRSSCSSRSRQSWKETRAGSRPSASAV